VSFDVLWADAAIVTIGGIEVLPWHSYPF